MNQPVILFKNKILYICIFLIISLATFSQERKNQLDISVFPYYNFVVLQTCDGGGGLDDGPGYRIGLQYSYKIHENKWLNTGLLVSQSTLTYYSGADELGNPGYYSDQTALIIQVPIRMKFELNENVYLKPGFTIDIQVQKDSKWNGSLQNGIGISLVGGYEFDLQKNWHLSLEPEISYLSMIQLPLGKRDNCHEHFLYLGLNVNFGFRFK
jgi:hypothetical protein